MNIARTEMLEDRTLLSTFTVTTLEDEADGSPDPGTGAGTSLREAMLAANASTGVSDIIDFDPGLTGTITLNTSALGALPAISDDVHIMGSGADRIAVSGNNAVRVFFISTGVTAEISGLTITNGRGNSGAGIANVGGNLTVTNSVISQNTATVASGGGISNSSGGTLLVQGSTLHHNLAEDSGGGIQNSATGSGSLTILNSTLSQNSAKSNGGGIRAVMGSTTTVVNSTLTQNVAQSTDNAGSGGGIIADGTETVVNTIVTGNTVGTGGSVDNISKTIEISSNNLFGGSAFLIIDPVLANNGGPTPTHALIPGSLALDAGDNTLATDNGATAGDALAFDQRGGGFPRIVGGTVDVGAFEYAPPALTVMAVINAANELEITGSGAADQITVSFDGTNIIIDVGAAPLMFLASAITGGRILVNGGDDNDTLTVDVSVNASGLMIVYDGQGQTGTPGDTLVLTGTSASVEYLFSNASSGRIQLNGSGTDFLTYAGLEPVMGTSVTAADVTLVYSGAADTIVVTDAGGGDINVTASGTAESTTFASPTNSLTIRGGDGDDMIFINSLPAGFTASLVIDGEGDTDKINFATDITFAVDRDLTATAETISVDPSVDLALSGTGQLSLTGETIQQEATSSITVADLTKLDAGAAGTIALGAAGNDFSTVAITAANTATLADVNAIAFRSASIASSLSITAAEIDFGGGADSIRTSAMGTLALVPVDPAQPIVVGAAADSGAALDITDADLAAIADGFSEIIIGNEAIGMGAVTILSSTFHDFIAIVGGSISVTELDAGINDVSLVARTGPITNGGDAGTDITGGTVKLDSSTGIGASGDVLSTTIATLAARTQAGGGVFVTNSNSLMIGTADGLSGVATANGPILLTVTGAGNVLSVNRAMASGVGSITLQADDVVLAATLSGSGALNLKPFSADRSIGIGTGAVGDFHLDAADLANLQEGFAAITLGDLLAGTGAVDVNASVFTDQLLIVGGTIDLAGLDAGANAVTLTARTGPITTAAGVSGTDITASSTTLNGMVAPGGSPGQLVVSGNLVLAADDTYQAEIQGDDPGTGYDQIVVAGDVTLGNATLTVSRLSAFVPLVGQAFVIVDNQGVNPISGTFQGLADNDQFLVNNVLFRIDYDGGVDSNDVVLTVLAPNTVYVDDDFAALKPGDDPAGPALVFGYDAFAAIQAGIDQVAAGGTVNLSDGTFTENPSISQSLTLNGSGPATVIDAGMGNGLTLVDGAEIVALQNLRITHAFHGIFDDSGGVITSLSLANLVIDGSTQGGQLSDIATLNVTLTLNDDTASVNDTQLRSTNLQPIAYAGVGDFVLNGDEGSDTFHVDPITSTNLAINGGNPTAPATPGDSLNYHGPGLLSFATADSGTITQTGFNTVSFTEIETLSTDFVSVTNGNFVVTASAVANDGDGDDFIARLDTSGKIEVVVVDDLANEIVVLSLAPVAVNSISIVGSDNNDTLTVDFINGNPIPLMGLFFTGSGDGINDHDRLVITDSNPAPGSVSSVAHTFQNASNGSLDIKVLSTDPASTITYTGLEPITDNLDALDRIFNFAAASDLITLADDNPDVAGMSRISSGSTSETVDFANPTGSLTINAGGGDDTMTLLALDAAFNANVIINGGLGRDTIDLQAATGATGNTYTLNGNEGADTYNVTPTPDAGPEIFVNGNAPAISPGDTLNYDGAATVISSGTPGSGTLDANAVSQDIVFTTIEALNKADTASISINDVTRLENGTFDFTISLSNAVSENVTVQVDTQAISAMAGQDFTAIAAQTVIFTAGGPLSQTVTVVVNNEGLVENDEIFQVLLSNAQFGGAVDPSRVVIADGVGVGTILNDDVATLSINDVTDAEGGTFTFTVTLSQAISQDVTVRVDTAPETADFNDFTSIINLTVTFAAGSLAGATQIVTVNVNNDRVVENNEVFEVRLSNVRFAGQVDPTRAVIADDVGLGTIQNVAENDTAFFSISDVTQSEATGVFNFTVSLSNPVAALTTVRVNTGITGAGPGDAASIADFAPISNLLLTFTPNGPLSQTVSVQVANDNIVERDETFTVLLSDARFNGVIDLTRVDMAKSSGLGTIVNDDFATLSINDVIQSEGNGLMQFTVTLSNPVSEAVAFRVNTVAGTATSGADYTAITNLMLTFTPGGPLMQIAPSVLITEDNIVERDEQFLVHLDSIIVGATAGDPRVTFAKSDGQGTIRNNDTAMLALVPSSTASESDGHMDFLLTLSNPVEGFITVKLDTVPATAQGNGVDYSSLIAQDFTFNTGDPLTHTVSVAINDDLITESSETFTLTISTPRFNGVADATRAVVTANQNVSTGTITDNDTSLLSISDVQAMEGGAFNFLVTLTGTVGQDVTVSASTTAGTGMSPAVQGATIGADFIGLSNEIVTFAANGPGVQTRVVTVQVNNDGLAEPLEDFRVLLANILYGGAAGVADVVFADNEGVGLIIDATPPITASFRDLSYSGLESNGSIEFTIDLSRAEPVDVITVDVSTLMTNLGLGRDAVSGGDFTPLSNFQVTFHPGETSKTVSVQIASDITVEPDETFQVVLSNPRVAGIMNIDRVILGGNSSETGTIRNDDSATISFVLTSVSQDEGDSGSSNLQFTVVLSNPVQGGLTVNYNIASTTATQGVDFLPQGPLTFAGAVANETRIVNVSILGDTLTERDETFEVQLLSALANQAAIDPLTITIPSVTATATGTILNDDSILVAAAGAGGGPHVRVFDQLGNVLYSFFAYDKGFAGGVRVATGDVTGDGTPDIITAPGPGMVPLIRMFDGTTGLLIPGSEFLAYAEGFISGVFVTAADLNGDGLADIITSPDAGGGPHVRVFSGADSSELFGFMAYSAGFLGGVRVATGDVTGDGNLDIITGPGAGGGPHVRVFNTATAAGRMGQDASLTDGLRSGSFFAFEESDTGGVFVAAANFGGALGGGGTHHADIIASQNKGGSLVRIFDALNVNSFDEINVFPGFIGGVRVGTVERVGNDQPDLIAAAGIGGGPHVRIYDGNTILNPALNPTLGSQLFAFDPGFTGGVFVAGTVIDDATAGSPLQLAAAAVLPGQTAAALTSADLVPIVSAAVARFEQQGLTPSQAAELAQTQFLVRDLGEGLPGLARDGIVSIDDDAAGLGWYIDPTPLSDEEFQSPTSAGLAATAADAVGRVDLLTVVLHELGHVLGRDDLPADTQAGQLMADSLVPSIRRLPDEETLDALFANGNVMESLLLADAH